jgi:hypothetical protein
LQKDCPQAGFTLTFLLSATAGDAPMPNQRSKNKAYIGGYIDKVLHAEIVRMANEESMEHNRFGFVEKLIREAIARRNKQAIHAGE